MPMMMNDKKKMASLIIAKVGKPMSEATELPPQAPEQDFKLAMEDAAKKMMEAIKSDQPAMFLQHLSDLLDMRSSMSGEEEED